MKRSNFLVGVLLAVCLVLIMGYPAFAAKTIKIGVIGPMNYSQGKGHWNGASMAADEINAKGGVKVGNQKMMIELVKADSNEHINITDATNAMERVITRDKVNFVIGGFRTEAVLPMQDIAMDYKTMFLGCGAATKSICDRVGSDYNRYKYWFRITPFSDVYLVKTNFLHMAFVGDILKKELGIDKIKVAIVAEKKAWTEGMVAVAQNTIPSRRGLGMEVVGTWRPSDMATDVTSELSAIQRSGAHIVFTIFSASVGVTFAKQAGELKIPVVMVGINVEAQKDGFWDATNGMGNYVLTMNTYAKGVKVNDLTLPFTEAYLKKFGERPTYTADTYSAIKYALVPAIEQAGSLDPEKIIPVMEQREFDVPSGRVKFSKDHDPVWGPGYLTSLGVQWQDGELKAVWPNGWEGISYPGMVSYKIPPYMAEKYKK